MEIERIQLKGERYYLKTLLPEDVSDKYVSWLNDPEVNRFLEVRFTVSNIENTRQWVSNFDNDNNYLFGIYTMDGDEHIGTITLHINPIHKTAEWGYLIGEKEYWGKGASIEAISLLFDYAFDELGIRKICGGAYINNIFSIINFKKLGLKQEGIRKKHCIFGDKYVDGVLYAVFKEDWEARRKAKLKKEE